MTSPPLFARPDMASFAADSGPPLGLAGWSELHCAVLLSLCVMPCHLVCDVFSFLFVALTRSALPWMSSTLCRPISHALFATSPSLCGLLRCVLFSRQSDRANVSPTPSPTQILFFFSSPNPSATLTYLFSVPESSMCDSRPAGQWRSDTACWALDPSSPAGSIHAEFSPVPPQVWRLALLVISFPVELTNARTQTRPPSLELTNMPAFS
jgi:hypothetical protein